MSTLEEFVEVKYPRKNYHIWLNKYRDEEIEIITLPVPYPSFSYKEVIEPDYVFLDPTSRLGYLIFHIPSSKREEFNRWYGSLKGNSCIIV